MTTARFDAATMNAMTYEPHVDGPPRVFFELRHPDVMVAEPPGVLIRCEYAAPRKSRVRVTTTTRDGLGRVPPEHIADVTVHATGSDDLTTETIAIASAIYWSWWRARDMKGEAPR